MNTSHIISLLSQAPRWIHLALASLAAAAFVALTASSQAMAQSAPAKPAPAKPAPAKPTPAPPTAEPTVAQPEPALPVTSARGDTEVLVPPQGGAVDVPMHAGTVCILSFPETLAADAISSSASFDVKRWGDDGIAVRAARDKVAPATLALATVGGLKVNVSLRVVPEPDPAFTMVRLKAVSAAEAFEAQVKAEVERRTAPIAQRLEKTRKDLDALIRERAEGEIADRMLRRNEGVRLEAHARNGDHVIMHVRRGHLLGEDGFIVFDIENRSGSAYRLAAVRVLAEGHNVAGATRLVSTAIARDPALIGIVAAGKMARGIVTVRSVNAVLNRPLVLELAMPDGRGAIRAARGIVLR